jgi:hypothetical protein
MHTSMPQQAPPFDELQRVLSQSRALTDAAEAHGTLVGSLCSMQCSLDDWLAEILPRRADPGLADSLRAIFDSTSVALGDGSMTFQPAAQRRRLDRRLTSALGEWCQGFFMDWHGLGLPEAFGPRGEAAEVVRDMTEITHVDVDPQDDPETNEAAYAELVEFVRVGVQLLYEQLQPLREPRPTGTRETLH